MFAAYRNVSVTENTITGCAVGLTASGQRTGVPSFTRNTVDGTGALVTPPYTSLGIYLTTSLWYWGSDNLTVNLTNNFVNNFADLLYIEPETGYTLTVTLFNNSFQGNTNGMSFASGAKYGGTYVVDASGNWWGTNTAAGVKALANGGTGIDFTPWLDVGTDTDAGTAGFQGDFSDLWVDDDSPQTGSTGRIQEGIDLVTTGGTVSVLAGTYAESPNLNKNATVDVQGDLVLNGSLTLSAGTWIGPASGLMQLSGNFTNNGGTFTHNNSTVEFNGSSAQTIGGTAENIFYNLTVDNSNGVGLGAAQTINGVLYLAEGNLILNAYNLNLGASASVSGSFDADHMLVADGTGAVCKTFSATGSFTYPVGDAYGTAEYSPATVSFTSGSSFIGCLRLVDQAHPNLPASVDYLTRYWVLNSPSSGYTINATFNYLDSDIVGSEIRLSALRYTSGTWSSLGGTINTGANTFTFTGLTTLSDFTASNMPTAVMLASLSGSSLGNTVLINWVTGSDLNLVGFNLYRATSPTGPREKINSELIPVDWQNPAYGGQYQFEDTTAEFGVEYVYWLEAVTADGGTISLGQVVVFNGLKFYLPVILIP